MCKQLIKLDSHWFSNITVPCHLPGSIFAFREPNIGALSPRRVIRWRHWVYNMYESVTKFVNELLQCVYMFIFKRNSEQANIFCDYNKTYLAGLYNRCSNHFLTLIFRIAEYWSTILHITVHVFFPNFKGLKIRKCCDSHWWRKNYTAFL